MLTALDIIPFTTRDRACTDETHTHFIEGQWEICAERTLRWPTFTFKQTYGICYDQTHQHREFAGYVLCDTTAQYWPIAPSARCESSAVTMAMVTGSIGSTQIITEYRDGEYVTAHWARYVRDPK